MSSGLTQVDRFVTKPKQYAVMLILSFLLSPQLYSQNHQPHGKFSTASIADSETRTKKIREELRRYNGDDWAGDYYFGDGLGVNVSLVLAPKSGFVFSWHGCVGLYDINYGDVAFTNGTIRLLFKYPNKREGFEGIAPVLLPVRWGERHYLIDADHVVDFTNAINAGTEPRPSSWFGGSFLLRRGDESKAVTGEPNLPNEFLSYILPKPIKANASVESSRIEHSRRMTYVNVDVGRVDGVKEGMKLYVSSPSSGILDTFVVTKVGEHSATAAITTARACRSCSRSSDWKLSTKLE